MNSVPPEVALSKPLGRVGPLQGPGTLSAQIFDAIEHAIITGNLNSSQRLRTEELAAHFGVSHIPVREALRALGADGWVQQLPRRGFYIRAHSEEELFDLFDARAVIESSLAARAAKYRTPDQVTRLDELVSLGAKAVKSGDPDQIAASNTAFHTHVGECANNVVLSGLLKRLSNRINFYFVQVTPGRGQESVTEHTQIVDAIRRGDPDTAASLALSHVEATMQAMKQTLETNANQQDLNPYS